MGNATRPNTLFNAPQTPEELAAAAQQVPISETLRAFFKNAIQAQENAATANAAKFLATNSAAASQQQKKDTDFIGQREEANRLFGTQTKGEQNANAMFAQNNASNHQIAAAFADSIKKYLEQQAKQLETLIAQAKQDNAVAAELESWLDKIHRIRRCLCLDEEDNPYKARLRNILLGLVQELTESERGLVKDLRDICSVDTSAKAPQFVPIPSKL